jgi:hypothetical protein
MEFFIDTTFWLHYGPVVESASNIKEYQKFILGGKSRWCIGMTPLPPSHANCFEIWEPEPPGNLSVCPGLYRNSFTFYIFDHKEAKGVDTCVNKQHAKKGTKGKTCSRWRWSTSLLSLQLLVKS